MSFFLFLSLIYRQHMWEEGYHEPVSLELFGSFRLGTCLINLHPCAKCFQHYRLRFNQQR